MQYIIQFLKYTINLQMLQNEQNFYEQTHECDSNICLFWNESKKKSNKNNK